MTATWEKQGNGYRWHTPTRERYVIEPEREPGSWRVAQWFASLQIMDVLAREVKGLNAAKAVAKAHYQDVLRIHGGSR